MSTVKAVANDDLRVIMCLAFDHRASVQEVAAFKTMLVQWEEVVSCCDLHGTFDFMVELELPGLKAYNDKLDGIKGELARLVSRYESNFVCNRMVRVEPASPERVVWVPCTDGVRRIDCALIDKVTAEGDYMRVHARGHSWLIHLTMGEMLARLDDEAFVRLHRSTTVRCDFVDRLLHQGRAWTARLGDGSIERIARSHLASVMTKLRASSASNPPDSSNPAQVGETPFLMAESPVRRSS